jgi:hypothetical protein
LAISILAVWTLKPDAAHQVVAQVGAVGVVGAVGSLELDRDWKPLGRTALFELPFDVGDIRPDDFFDFGRHDRAGMR